MIYLPSRSLLTISLLTACVVPLAAQIPGIQATQPPSSAQQQEAPDPLGRTTPRGMFLGFNRVVHRGDLATSTQYMQGTERQRRDWQPLARHLGELIDRHFDQVFTTINDSATGALDDGLPPDREKLGPLRMKNGETDIILVRVKDPVLGPLWLISSETLAKVPALYKDIEKSWVERVMPQPLLDHDLFGISLAQWMLLLASLLIPLWSFSILISLVVLLAKIPSTDSTRRNLDTWRERTHWPLLAALTLIAHLIVLRSLGFSLSFRVIDFRLGAMALIAAITLLILRISAICFGRARSSLQQRRRPETESLMLLGQRVFNVVIILGAILLILTVIGVDTTTALTGVGIGGVALALGARRTLENVLGGISLIADKVLAVGDFCCVSNRLGTIEDITLRSIRLRTLEQTLLSIPTGILSQESVENFTSRKKILVQTPLRLRYGARPDQVRTVLEGIRHLLVQNPKVETETARVRLVNFGEQAIELELFAYVLTPDIVEFLGVREEIFLHVADIVESAGTEFASRTELAIVKSATDREVHFPPVTKVAS
jgi:MscS family membrane protein